MKSKRIYSKREQFKKFAAKEHTFLKKIVGGEDEQQATYQKVKW